MTRRPSVSNCHSPLIITIDGPVASGKTSVARAVAQRLGYTYLASGMLYRAIAYSLSQEYAYDEARMKAPDHADIDAVIAQLSYSSEPSGPRLYYGDHDITQHLKLPQIDTLASLLALTPYVHHALCILQRNFAKSHDIVVESRDAGTVVFPHAQCKFFLTASCEERARRWQYDQTQRGVQVSFEESQKLINERDQRDTTRSVSPLVMAADAQLIDSTHMSFDEVVETIVARVRAC